MRKMTTFLSSCAITLLLSVSAQAQFGAGSCNFTATQMFPTIQAAVNAATPGSTIDVCPGVYPEQVTISKPLTLQGRAFGNSNRASITMDPNMPINPNVTSIEKGPIYAQIAIQNLNPPGAVNLTGITVDGTGAAPDSNGNPVCTTGIFYASGTAGTVNEVTTRNQRVLENPLDSTYCGDGIWAENGAGVIQNVTIENSSVHDFGRTGITTVSTQEPSTLSATVYANFVNHTIAPPLCTDGISVRSANVTVANNFITEPACAPASFAATFAILAQAESDLTTARLTISNNTITDNAGGLGVNLWQVPGTVQGNKISGTYIGIAACDDGAILDSNSVFNATAAALFGCHRNPSITNQVINDTGTAFADMAGATLQGNQVHNADLISQ